MKKTKSKIIKSKTIRGKIFWAGCGLFAALLVLGGGPVLGDDRLRQGWEEYGFQAFSNARSLFNEVEGDDKATAAARFEARLGLAFVVHYQMPGRDPEAAVPLYEALLEEAADARLQGLVLARLGDALIESDPPQLEAGRDHYRRALEVLPAASLLGQETALRLLTTYMETPDPKAFARGLDEAEGLAGRLEGTAFASVFYGIQAELAFFLGDLGRMARALEKQYEAGISNVRVKEKVLFQLARLFEVELGDFAAAQRYYRLLAAEVPSSQKAYFARLRADELAAGKIDSDFAPPLSVQVEGPATGEGRDGR